MTAFNGDPLIERELKNLVKKWHVKTILETGTYQGESTRAFAAFGPHVVTIENDLSRFQSLHLDQLPNVTSLHGDSAHLLPLLIPTLPPPVLFYLDAHGNDHSPLLDELQAIAQTSRNASIIAIHDCFNPLHPEYTFDTWDIGQYRLELVTAALNQIYGPHKWTHHFNANSLADPPRGIIYIEPL